LILSVRFVELSDDCVSDKSIGVCGVVRGLCMLDLSGRVFVASWLVDALGVPVGFLELFVGEVCMAGNIE
jgi:hypothetical protein